jgi:hypothetical protein
MTKRNITTTNVLFMLLVIIFSLGLHIGRTQPLVAIKSVLLLGSKKAESQLGGSLLTAKTLLAGMRNGDRTIDLLNVRNDKLLPV